MGALAFLTVGVLCLVRPRSIQHFARQVTDSRSMFFPFISSDTYIPYLQILGFIFAVAGMSVMVLLLVPGLLER
jgi:hypothetical protein